MALTNELLPSKVISFLHASSHSCRFLPDTHDQIFTSDEFSKTGLDNLEASAVPEVSSGYEVSTADLLGQVSTEPTVTAAVTLSDDVTTEEAPDESTGI